MLRRVLPQPAPPVTNVVRPFGKPPPVISSRPGMPVGDLGSARVEFDRLARAAGINFTSRWTAILEQSAKE